MISERRIPAHDVRHLCGGVSDMTLWRWLKSNDLDFPQPTYIGKRRYWRESDVIAWLDARTETPPHEETRQHGALDGQ